MNTQIMTLLCSAAQRTLALLLVVPGLTALPAYAQMSVPGSFAVTPSGAATYSIPIQAPPGIAGLEPKLAFNYSSQSGNELLGVGWSLSGLSTISRCPQTSPQDGAKKGVNWSATDRFCLDGQRLMVVTGTYGSANSEYRTEIETFSKITAYGAAVGGGPLYFIVKTKSGLTLEFGNTTDSRLYPQGVPGQILPQVVRAWAINKIYDSTGNTLTTSYIVGGVTSGLDRNNYYPNRIDYTSNSNTGLTPSSAILFNYETRPDTIGGYQSGLIVDTQKRLKNITTQSGGSTIFVYSPIYEISPATSRSRITSVTLCNSSGACLPATTTTLSNVLPMDDFGNATPLQSSPNDTCLSSCGSWQTLDLNNDGKMDLVHLKDNSGNISVWLSTGYFTFTVQNYQIADTSLTTGTWYVFDVNGDGRADLVHLKDDAGHVSVWLSNGDGTFAISNLTFSTDTVLSNGIWLVLDVDGDGLADLVHVTTNSGDMRLWKSNGNGTFTMSAITRAANSPSGDTNLLDGGSWQVLDVNGDGLADLVHLTNNSGDLRVWKSNADGTFTISQFTTADDTSLSNGFWQVLDVNRDGLLDLLHFTTNSGDMRVWMSHGDATFHVYPITSLVDTSLTTGTWQVVDFNGDGLQDLIHLTNTTDAYLWTFKESGALNGPPVKFRSFFEACLSCSRWQVGDFTGKGFVDMLHMLDDSGNYVVWKMPRLTGDLPSAISSGIGTKISWTMNALPEILNQSKPGYTMSLGSSNGTTTVIPAMPVVTGVDTNDGVGGARHTAYDYDSVRVERNGRGYLGFNWTQATDLPTGLVSRTVYNLAFPFTGMPYQVGRGTSAALWNNLSLMTTDYGCNNPALNTATDCIRAVGSRYFIYPHITTTTSKDLDGTPLPGTQSVSENFDPFGNVGTVTTRTLNPDGSATEYSSTVTNTYAPPDLTKWYIGRLVKSTVASTGPTVPGIVVPGNGGLPPAPSPNLPPQLLSIILNLLLDD